VDRLNEDAAACARGFGDLPLIVMVERWGRESKAESERQDRLAHRSTRGKRVDLECGHLIPLEQPDAVIQAVKEILPSEASARTNR
jgi:hypothetical protein